ncbi:hypothetical protein FRC06_009360, partial [Ceratobasidium sp. 370]
MMALLYLYVIIYSFAMGPLPWVYSSEIYPLRIRELGQMWFTALTSKDNELVVQGACNFATSKVTPVLFVKLEWRTWMLFAALNLGGSIICWLICPETKGLSMEEIDILFGAVSAEQRAADIERVLHGQGDGNSDSMTPIRQSSLSAATTYYSCIGDWHSENQASTHNLDFVGHQGVVEPAPATRARYQEFRRSLGHSLRQAQPRVHQLSRGGEPPNFRAAARKNLARLHRVQFMELVTDVYDEVVRMNNYRDGNVPIPSFLLARNDYHPKRNEARRKIANLGPNCLKILMSDVFHELGRRYPNLKEAESVSVSTPARQPSLGRLPVDTTRAQAPTQQTAASPDIPRAPVGTSTMDSAQGATAQAVDVVSSKMSITEVILILGQHGCPNITGMLDIHKCKPTPAAGGGFGDVYQGHLRDGSQVAIKCPRLFLDKDEIRRVDLK